MSTKVQRRISKNANRYQRLMKKQSRDIDSLVIEGLPITEWTRLDKRILYIGLAVDKWYSKKSNRNKFLSTYIKLLNLSTYIKLL